MILAVDPGSSSCGFALVEPAGTRVEYVDAGAFPADGDAFAALFRGLHARIHTVAVERPAGYAYDPARSKHLLATGVSAGGVAWVGAWLGKRVVEVTATEVRRALLGKARLGPRAKEGDVDRLIKAALPGLVLEMPARTNVHVRDALAVAVVANWLAHRSNPS